MKTFRAFFFFELKRFASRRNVLFFLLLLFFSLYFLQSGINEYEDILNRKDTFLEFEEAQISQYNNYTQYGGYGFRMLFIPSPLVLLFNQSAAFPDLTAFVDSGARLNIYLPFKGKDAFDLKNFGLTDFSGIMLFFGTLLALFYGYETFHNDEYLKFLSSLASYRRVFFSILGSRMIFVAFLLLVLIGVGLLLVLLNGLYLPLDSRLLSFTLLVILLSLFFLLLGALLGTIKSILSAVSAMLSCWFVFLFLIPTVINIGVARHADLMTPLYQMEMEKLKTLMDFERQTTEKAGRFKEVTETERETILSYWNNEFKKINSMEQNMIGEMKKSISLYQNLSMLFPTTLYLSVNQEISSRGYSNLINFYKYVLDQKSKFFKFYMDKVYFSNYSEVESFVKDKENLFFAHSNIPATFWPGLLATLFYTAVLLTGSYHRFRRSLFALSIRELRGFDQIKLNLKRSELRVWLTYGHPFKNLLYILFSGEARRLRHRKFTGQVFLDRVNLMAQKNRENFLYLCSPAAIPGDIKVKDLLRLLSCLLNMSRSEEETLLSVPVVSSHSRKRFAQLDNRERGEVLLALTPTENNFIYLFQDMASGMPVDFAIRFKDKMDSLKRAGSLVIYLTSDDAVRSKGLEKGQLFFETPTWCKVVEQYKSLVEH